MTSSLGSPRAPSARQAARPGRRVAALAGRCALVVSAALAAVAAPASGDDTAGTGFAPDEVARILSHGPWPPPVPGRDPSNRVSGNADAIAFGERLFFDTRLSSTGLVSCARCHQPGRYFTDGHERSIGIAPTDRNAPTVVDVRGRRWYGWDGSHDNLWSQSIRPLLDPREMGMTPATVARTIRREQDFACRYRMTYHRDPPADDRQVLVDVAKALAAFQESLASGRTPFDDFRDALARGDRAAMARYPEAAKRGLKIFVGRGSCSVCHVGPAFTNGEFHDIGLGFFAAPGRVDPGRHAGIARLRANSYNLLGRYSDDPARTTATSTRHVVQEHRNFGEFRVPGLRNVAATAPYMHDGSLKSLREVVRHYSEIDEERLHVHGERILRPLRLTEPESADLVAFLESLGDGTPVFRLTQRARPACEVL
ncbi:Cytochrome c551 peroxidase [Burkholderiales bacterium]|nr:Cytochrome c551 peroxidase [Burkholderiales bacterium]